MKPFISKRFIAMCLALLMTLLSVGVIVYAVQEKSDKQASLVVAALSTVVLVSIVSACYATIKSIFDKLSVVQDAAHRIAHGDFSVRITEHTSNNRLNGLVRAFNDMADNLSHTISALQQSDIALKQSEQRFRTFVENATDIVLAMTPSGTFDYISPQLKESLGYDPSEVVGKSFVQFVHPDDIPAFHEFLAVVQKTDKKQRGVEFRAVHKNGTWLWFTVNGSRIIDQTGDISIIGIGRDITEHKLIQNELIKAQKLESISTLAGGIAHNFNNVLTAVIGYLSFAKKHLRDHDKVLPLLEAAEKSSFKAAGLARQLLTFSKGGIPFRKLVSAEHLVREAVSLFLTGSNVKGIIDNQAALAINVDSEQINQAFSNIILNSINSMPHGGVLTVHIEDMRLDNDNVYLLKPGDYLRIAFRDCGCGIMQEHLPKVFDPYFTTRENGSGLGLSTTHTIITKHDGHIDVVSEAAHGTTVTIILPGYPAVTPDATGTTEEATRNPAKISLLIMDDEEDIRDLAADRLGEAGYQVRTCCSGEEAVEHYRECWKSGATLPIAILDLLVPAGMGGDEAARHILSIDPQARLIISSGNPHDPIVADYKKHGFSATLSKPYNSDDLVEVIRRVQQIISIF